MLDLGCEKIGDHVLMVFVLGVDKH